MGLDSVELVMAWEDAFGIEIPDSAAESMRTTADAVDYIHSRVGTGDNGGCAGRRAFFQVRGALIGELGLPRNTIRPETPVRVLLGDHPGRVWRAVGTRAGFASWPSLPLLGAGPTVGEVARGLVGRAPGRFLPPGGLWSRGEVREMVRAIIVEETGVKPGFADDAELVRDLGIS